MPERKQVQRPPRGLLSSRLGGPLQKVANISIPRPWLAYGIAVVATGVATCSRWWLEITFGEGLPPFITYYPLVMLTALYGGTGPGLVATVLASLTVDYVFLHPLGFGVVAPGDRVALIIFSGINAAVSIVCGALRAAHHLTFAQARAAELSERRLRATFHQAAVGIFEVDTEDRIRLANQRAGDLLGYAPEELAGKTVSDLTHPEDRELSCRLNRELHEGRRQMLNYEKRYLKRDGSSIWVHVNVSTILDAEGREIASIGTFEDITLRKQAQEAMRLSEERYRQLFDSIDQSFSIIEVLFDEQQKPHDFRFLETNPAFEKITGLVNAEGKRMRELAPNHELFWFETYGQVALTGNPVRFESWAREFKKWFDVYAFRFGAPEQRQVAILFKDITERKQADETLRVREEQFRALAESIPQLVWTANSEGQFNYVNERWSQYTGLSAEASNGSGWCTALHPVDRARAVEGWKRAISTGEVYEVDYRLRRQDGQYRWFLARAVPLRNARGHIDRWFGTTTDIDEQKRTLEALQESQTRLRLAVETAELGTYERDLVTNELTMNAQCREILGVSGAQLPPDVARRAVHPEDQERVFAAVARAFDPALREVCAAEFRIIRPDVTMRWVAGRGRVLFDDSVSPPRPLRFIGALNDITNRKRLQTELEHHARELERLIGERTAKLQDTVAELEGFSYSLVHDMRAPLRAMLGYADILEEDLGNRIKPEEANLLRKFKTAAFRMDQLITDSLNYSKILRQDLPVGAVNLGTLLRGMVETYPNFHANHADITINVGDVVVQGNEAALTQVFSNLLGNAVKFVAPGVRPQVRVWAAPGSNALTRKGQNGSVRVFVADNGIGIEKASQTRIFNMFQRLHTAAEYPGTGIGLALVKKSLERTGGRISLESEPGKGSCFCVELPLAATQPERLRKEQEA